MAGLRNPHDKSKGNGAAPPSRHHDPATTAIKFQRLVGHLHALGPRPVAELLTELVGHDEQARSDVLHLLEKYSGLDPAGCSGSWTRSLSGSRSRNAASASATLP